MENLPVDLVGTNVLGYLSEKDIVMMERACGSKKSHQLFLNLISYCAPIELAHRKHYNILALKWFVKTKCRISYLNIYLPGNNPCLHVEGLNVDYFELEISANIKIKSLKRLINNNIGSKVISIDINGKQNKEVMEQLNACTGNVKKLDIRHSDNCMDWLTINMLRKWSLSGLELVGSPILSHLTLIVQTCTELTTIKLSSHSVDDAVMLAVAQYCPKLKYLVIFSSRITAASFIELSARGLPLEELKIWKLPNIPTADIARRCSLALSRIRHLYITDGHRNSCDANRVIPYMTELTSVYVYDFANLYIPLLTQYCSKLTEIDVGGFVGCTVAVMLSLCCANPLLQELHYGSGCFTDTALIELIHACPHLHTLWLHHETTITDLGILALSENCPQLQFLMLRRCSQVTEAAIIQLLQRCHKLTRLEVSSSSLSKETWTQLDMNTQKRVSRW